MYCGGTNLRELKPGSMYVFGSVHSSQVGAPLGNPATLFEATHGPGFWH